MGALKDIQKTIGRQIEVIGGTPWAVADPKADKPKRAPRRRFNRRPKRKLRGQRLASRLVADADDVREEDRERPQHRARHGGANPGGRAGLVLNLVRDVLGRVNLVWCPTEGGLAFATDVRGLHGLPGVERSLDLGNLALFFHGVAQLDETHTVWRGVERIPARHRLVADADGIYPSGTWLRCPPGAVLTAHTEEGCLLYQKRGHLTAVGPSGSQPRGPATTTR